MRALRFIPMLLVLACVQVGLWSALATAFSLQPRGKRNLAAALCALALFFVGFLVESRNGLQLPAHLRALFVEPLLAVEALTLPLLLLLGLLLSAAQRAPGGFSESRRAFIAGAAKGLVGATGAAAALGISEAELAPQLTR